MEIPGNIIGFIIVMAICLIGAYFLGKGMEDNDDDRTN